MQKQTYSCGNDPQPGDVVEVVTMDDLPEESWWNQAITEKLQKGKHYSVFAVAFGDWICLFNKPEIIWHHPSRFRLIRRAGETDNKRNIFEELIQTIERTAVNNTATISNVKLWAKSWREEWVGEPERERGWTINGEQPQPGDEEVRTPIQDALYATSKFTTDDCTLLADGILMYLKDAGMGIVRQPQPDMAKLLEEKEREIERLKEQVNDLKMDAAAHEYNEAERIKFQPEYEREICVRFAEYIGGLEMKMYKDGWCEPGGSNGFYYSTNDLYTKFLGEHTANH